MFATTSFKLPAKPVSGTAGTPTEVTNKTGFAGLFSGGFTALTAGADTYVNGPAVRAASALVGLAAGIAAHEYGHARGAAGKNGILPFVPSNRVFAST